MTVQRSHNRSTSVSSLASVSSFKTAHSASPIADNTPLPDTDGIPPDAAASLDHTAEDEMLLTPVSSSGSGPPSPPQPQAQASLVAATQTPLPPTPPPRRRTLLLGKGHPRHSSTQESKPPPALPSHAETPNETAERSQATTENGQPESPRSLASRLSLTSLEQQQQSPTSYESHASRLSHPPPQPHTAPAQRELPTSEADKQGAQESEGQTQEQARWSRPPRSQARKVSKTMQLARDEPSTAQTTAPLRPGSSASVASAASSANGRAASPTSPSHSGRQPRYSESVQSHAVPQTPPTHTRSSSSRSARSDYPSFEEQDDAWAAHVKAQLLRLFPDLGATLPDRSAPVSGLRDELSALRSEIGALRGVVGQLRDERVGGTPPLATKQSRASSVPVPDSQRDAGPAKSRSLAIDTSFATATAGSDADDDSHYSEEEPPRRRAPMPPRERLSMYHPSPQEPEMDAGGLTIFATDSDARITLPPSAISLMLDVVRTVDMRTNGVRSDADIFSEENLANLAISQVMN